MTLLRTQLGDTLRGHRLRQRRTLRDVSGRARVSLGYLSEVERGQKEASSELLASICDALDVELADLLAEVSLELRTAAPRPAVRPVPAGAVRPADDEPAEDVDTEAATPEPALALVGAGGPAPATNSAAGPTLATASLAGAGRRGAVSLAA
ncbi:helix-turn-helix domain-containing protein [Goekera deserti]|uniref:helix-turn-helix domain-containing protein n=1 Tax=Goekera deserti TaxID=2497753 RepID=UPI001F45BAE6|nr:helix-turn-helix transcriptional regulator [Goekera deserti]